MIFHWADGNGGRRKIVDDYKNFVGADFYQAGASGFVPAPEIDDRNKYLHGGGSWAPFLLDTEPSTLEGAMWLSTY